MNRTEIERIATSIHGLRSDWAWNSLCTFIAGNLAERPYRDVAVALTYVACEAETRTPRRVLEPGPWWNVGPAAERPTVSGVLTFCLHGEPGTSCQLCHAPAVERAPMTAEQRTAIRDAVADGRAHVASLRADLA